jgi:hypothetical protein
MHEWTATIREFADIQAIDRETALKLIDKIEIGEREIIGNQKQREVRIHCKFVEFIGEQNISCLKGYGSNEWYARDISKKCRASKLIKGRSGEPLATNVPYGYKKDPDDPKRWIIDEEAAAVVQKVFSLCVDGLGPAQIGGESPLTFRACNLTVTFRFTRAFELSVVGLETTQISASNGYDCFPVYAEAREQRKFRTVVKCAEYARRFAAGMTAPPGAPTKIGDMGIFSGLLFCEDCGGKMYLCRASHFKPEKEYYVCSTYRYERELCTTHTIHNMILHEIVLRNLREAIAYVSEHEDDRTCLHKRLQRICEKIFCRARQLTNVKPLWLNEETNAAMRKISRKDARLACEDMF